MSERRKSPRTRCRLGCQIRRGRDRIRARVLDVSENGLCVISPVELKKGQYLHVVIDVPNHGPAEIQARVWHVRRGKKPSTGRRVWSAGMILIESDDTYSQLLSPSELNSPSEGDLNDKQDELQVFRVRVQVKGEPRSRLLTLAALTEQEASEFALADLDNSWRITEIFSVSAAS